MWTQVINFLFLVLNWSWSGNPVNFAIPLYKHAKCSIFQKTLQPCLQRELNFIQKLSLVFRVMLIRLWVTTQIESLRLRLSQRCLLPEFSCTSAGLFECWLTLTQDGIKINRSINVSWTKNVFYFLTFVRLRLRRLNTEEQYKQKTSPRSYRTKIRILHNIDKFPAQRFDLGPLHLDRHRNPEKCAT